LRRAEALGTDVHAVQRWPERLPNHPVTVECTSTADGLRLAIASTEAGGICTAIGMQLDDVRLPLWTMYMKGITLHTGRTQGASQLRPVLDAIAAERIDPDVLDPTKATWTEAPKALLSNALKLVLQRDPA